MDAKNGHPAHDRFKARDGPRFAIGITVAFILHLSLFILWPEMTILVDEFATKRRTKIVGLPPETAEKLMPEIAIPMPPKPISKPAFPIVVSDIQLDPNITIPKVTFEESPIPKLPPPPTIEKDTAIVSAPKFTPYSVRPEVKNRDEIERLLKRSYKIFAELGIEGTVMLWFYIDEKGNPREWLVAKSSGYSQLDEMALRLAPRFKFRPALNLDKSVPVWIQIPIAFKIDNP